jgi:hypothetical protein
VKGQESDSQTIRFSRLLPLLMAEAKGRPAQTAAAYERAVAALGGYVAGLGNGIGLTAGLLADWCAFMMIVGGIARKTVYTYINNISALYGALVKGGAVEESSGFADIKARLRGLDARLDGRGVTAADFSRLQGLVMGGGDEAGRDFVALAMLNPGLSAERIALLTKDDIPGLSADSQEIARRASGSSRKYVLPLGQGSKTPRQLRQAVDEMVTSLLGRHNIAVFGSADSTLRSYRAFAALSAGVSPAAVAALTGAPVGAHSLALCSAREDGAASEDVAAAQAAVIGQFAVEPRWHAMRLRPGVKFAEVTTRLDGASASGDGTDGSRMEFSLGADAGVIQFYYPCAEIARRTGKKLVYRSQPVISDIAFFRCRPSAIAPLFARVGDIAWCYRAADGSPATISTSAMHAFQTAVGIFTPDTSLYPLGAMELQPDDVVEVVGDLFAGYRGRVEGAAGEEGLPATVYRLIITGDNGLEWRVPVDRRLLIPRPTA